MLNQDKAMEEIRSNTAALLQYHGTDMFIVLKALLEALYASYLHDLVDVSGEDLAMKQGAARQVALMAKSLESGGLVLPKI